MVTARVAARVNIARSVGTCSACFRWPNVQISALRCLRAKRGLRSSKSAYAQVGDQPLGGLYNSQQAPKPATKVASYRRRKCAVGNLTTKLIENGKWRLIEDEGECR